MKRIISFTFALALVVGLAGTVRAEETKKTTTTTTASTTPTTAEVNNAIEMTRTLYQADKKAIVAENLGLTDKESEGFWKVYNEFQTDLMKVNDKKLNVIKKYAAHYEGLSNEVAKTLLDDQFKAQKEEIKVRESYRSRFGKILPAWKVARYYQIENKLALVSSLAVAKEIPLAK
jgi:ribosomal protein L7/L12